MTRATFEQDVGRGGMDYNLNESSVVIPDDLPLHYWLAN
jgi:hypothetical protein